MEPHYEFFYVNGFNIWVQHFNTDSGKCRNVVTSGHNFKLVSIKVLFSKIIRCWRESIVLIIPRMRWRWKEKQNTFMPVHPLKHFLENNLILKPHLKTFLIWRNCVSGWGIKHQVAETTATSLNTERPWTDDLPQYTRTQHWKRFTNGL